MYITYLYEYCLCSLVSRPTILFQSLASRNWHITWIPRLDLGQSNISRLFNDPGVVNYRYSTRTSYYLVIKSQLLLLNRVSLVFPVAPVIAFDLFCVLQCTHKAYTNVEGTDETPFCSNLSHSKRSLCASDFSTLILKSFLNRQQKKHAYQTWFSC